MTYTEGYTELTRIRALDWTEQPKALDDFAECLLGQIMRRDKLVNAAMSRNYNQRQRSGKTYKQSTLDPPAPIS